MLVRSAIAATASSVYERIISLIGVALLSRLITPADIGTFALCGSIVTLVGELLNMGFQFALISHSRLTASAIWSHAVLQVAFAATFLMVTIVLRPMTSQLFGQTSGTILVVLAFTRLIVAIGATSRVLLERELRFTALGVVNMLAATASVGLGIVLARRGYGIWALALAAGPPSLIGAAIQAVGYVALWPLSLRRFTINVPELRWYLAYGRTLWMGGQAFALSTQLDSIIIGTMLGPVPLALYDRAYRIVQAAVGVVNQTFGRVALPIYARLHAHDSGNGRRFQEINAALLLRLILPGAVLLTLAASQITRLLLGPGWEGTAVLLAVLAPYLVFRVLDENLLAYLLGVRSNWERTGGWLIVAGVSVIALPIGAVVAGSVGVAAAVGLAMAAGVCWQQHKVGPGSLTRIARDGVRPLVIALTVAAIVLALSRLAWVDGVVEVLVLKTSIVVLLYVGLLLLFEGSEVRRLVKTFQSAQHFRAVPPAVPLADPI